MTAAVLVTTGLTWGLLATGREDLPVPAEWPGARAEAAHLVDLGHCQSARRELRFGWLKPGEEPLQDLSGSPPACLAVYPLPPDPR
jgi:hypothetical protein